MFEKKYVKLKLIIYLVFVFPQIPKIEKKQDMIVAREKAKDTESDVFFIFFHNEADTRNRHIGSYLEIKDKYSHMANFYRTDTGFALFWAEQLGKSLDIFQNCFFLSFFKIQYQLFQNLH